MTSLVFSLSHTTHRHLHSFPTRRSSDLASSSWKRFCLFVCRALSSIMVICMLTAIRLLLTFVMKQPYGHQHTYHHYRTQRPRSEERFSRNAETDLVCRLLLEKKKKIKTTDIG